MGNANRRTQFDTSSVVSGMTPMAAVGPMPDNAITTAPLPTQPINPAGTPEPVPLIVPLPVGAPLNGAEAPSVSAAALSQPAPPQVNPIITAVPASQRRAAARQMSAMDCATASLPAVQSLVEQLLATKRLPDQYFYLVTVPDAAVPKLEMFESVEQLRGTIMGHIGKPVAIFAFLGYRLGITPGPLRYLRTPYGDLPLFALPDPGSTALDDSGWMGEESQELEIPQSPNPEVEDESITDTPPVPAGPAEDDLFGDQADDSDDHG